jgi:5'-nucleotidase
VYLHEFKVQTGQTKKPQTPKLKSKLIKITDKLPDDEITLATAAKWKGIAWADFQNQGFQPDRIIRNLETSLDGLEANIRNHQTNLGNLIASAYQWAAGATVQAGILNGGSIRIDDHIHTVLTEYDVLRVLPFGGNVVSMEMKGSLLQQWLQDGKANKGSGGYLQYTSNIKIQDGIFLLNDTAIDANTWYSIATSDFMLTGKEKNMGYLNPENSDIRLIHHYTQPDQSGRDVRHAFIGYLDYTKSTVK